MGKHKDFGEPIKCLNESCTIYFQRTTRHKSQKYCNRECVPHKVTNREYKPLSQDVKDKISKSRQGKGLWAGQPCRNNDEHMKRLVKLSSQSRTKTYPILECTNEDCNNKFQLVSKDTRKKYCSKKCANHSVGKNSNIGEFNRGKTPSEGSGRCKWYDYTSTIAGQVRVQGTWELRFAHCLDAIGIEWRTNHNKDRFSYIDKNGEEKTYSPDFYSNGKYFEIKGYLDETAEYKMKQVKKSNLNVELVFWEDLKNLETKYFGKPLSGVNTLKKVVEQLTSSSGTAITMAVAPLTGEKLRASYRK